MKTFKSKPSQIFRDKGDCEGIKDTIKHRQKAIQI